MVQIIEIEGDLARIVNREVVHSANLADVIPHIENRPPVTMFHPRSALFTHWDESNPADRKVKFLCELAPGIRWIVKSNRRYRLALPWTYFVFSFRMTGRGSIFEGQNWALADHFVFHARDRVRSLDSRLWTAFLPNVYEDGRICFGSTGVDTYQPLADRVDQLVNEWYLTQFNNDVHDGRHHPLPFNGRLPNGWALWVNATRDHGLQAIQQMPEWNITDGTGGVASWTVREILTGETPQGNRVTHAPFPAERVLVAQMVDEVPPIETPWTFGRIEEWYAQLNPIQRFRIRTAANNYVADHPDAIEEPPAPVIAEGEPTDDGGETVEPNEQTL